MSLPIKSLEVIHGTGRRNHLVSGPEGTRVHQNPRQDGQNLLAEGRSSRFSQGEERFLQGDSETQRGSSEGSGYQAYGSVHRSLADLPDSLRPNKDIRAFLPWKYRLPVFIRGVRMAFKGTHPSLELCVLAAGVKFIALLVFLNYFVAGCMVLFSGGAR